MFKNYVDRRPSPYRMISSRQGRSPRNVQLPAIGYYPDDGAVEDDDSHRSIHRQTVTSSRLNVIETRLAQQERTTNALLDRALKIKKDVIESLDLTHGSWYEEKQARQLLQDHIRTITDVVRKLNRDIEYLENQLRERDGAAVGTHSVVKNLEMNQVVGVTDLRGRVVRCDASIARLAADLKTVFDSVRSLSQQQLEQNSRLVESVHALDARIHEMKAALDRSQGGQTLQQQQLMAGTNQHLTELNARHRLLADELRHEIQMGRTREQAEHEKLETRIIMNFEKLLTQRKMQMDGLEQKVEEQITMTELKLLKMGEEITKEAERLQSFYTKLQNEMKSNLEGNINRHNDEIENFKRESRTGFSTVHDAVANMKNEFEGKLGILEEKMRKEIAQLRKMVVLV